MWNLKKKWIQNLQNKNRLADCEKLMVTKGDGWEVWRDGLGAWDWHMNTEVNGMVGQWGPAI